MNVIGFGCLGIIVLVIGFIFMAALSGPTPPPPDLNTATKLQSAGTIIRAHGFDCLDAVEVRPGFLSGFRVRCNGASGREYNYSIDDQGGRWIVEFRY